MASEKSLLFIFSENLAIGVIIYIAQTMLEGPVVMSLPPLLKKWDPLAYLHPYGSHEGISTSLQSQIDLQHQNDQRVYSCLLAS